LRLVAWAVGVPAALACPWVLGEGYHLHLVIMSLIFAIAAASLGLIVGYAGLLSLGHTAFFGLGAYVSALLFLHGGVPLWGGMLAGAAAAAAVAFLLGRAILGVRGHRFVIVTVAFAEIMRLVAYNWVDVTRGPQGLPGILAPKLALPGLGAIDFTAKTNFYYLALVVAFVCIALLSRIARSPLGWGFLALRENEQLGESIGVGAFRHAMLAFVIGAFFAGIGGALYAHYLNIVSPDVFFFSNPTMLLVMVVMGGLGTIAGPVVGAFVFTALPEYLRVASDYRLVFFGSLLIVAVLFFPRGLVELGERLAAAWRQLTGRR
jgi:branched-chain amino acid transport system permease protein